MNYILWYEHEDAGFIHASKWISIQGIFELIMSYQLIGMGIKHGLIYNADAHRILLSW
jgi:hypothetical protein